MKKSILLALVLLLILSLAGCGMSRSLTDEEINDIDHGTMEDGVYENAHFGIGYELDEDWNTETQDQIWARNEWKKDKDIHEQMIKSLKKPNYFWEMHTESAEQDVTVDVSIDNVAVIADPDISEEEYAKHCAEDAMDHWEQIEASGVEVTVIEQTVADKQCHGFLVTCEYQGNPIYFKTLYVRKGIYAAEIKVTCIGEDVTDEILENFYAVENQPF